MVGISTTIAPSENQRRILEAISRKGAELPCPRCGNTEFLPENGFFGMFLAANPGTTQMEHHVSLVAMTCTRCGYFSLHNLKILEK